MMEEERKRIEDFLTDLTAVAMRHGVYLRAEEGMRYSEHSADGASMVMEEWYPIPEGAGYRYGYIDGHVLWADFDGGFWDRERFGSEEPVIKARKEV